jgi:uncharacterized protein YcbK (DUF882 family)
MRLQMAALHEARDMRSEKYAEMDRRVYQALRKIGPGGETVKELVHLMCGRYREGVVSASLRRMERAGHTQSFRNGGERPWRWRCVEK